jgi:osmoprotectant transport system permease protein
MIHAMHVRAMRWACAAAAVLLLGVHVPASADGTLRIGSKRFTESYILGELLVQTAAPAGPAEHKAGLGNTGILHAALRSGAIDVYPEYTGTIAREILKLEGDPSLSELNAALAPLGLAASVPLGFNNSYALGVREEVAQKLQLRSISAMAAHGALRLGLSQEFLARKDGWPGVAKAYGLSAFSPAGLDHGLAYEALASGRIDVMDLYSTDAKIGRYKIRVLDDDRRFFPRYEAVLLHRADVAARFPAQWGRIGALQGQISTEKMIRLNAASELEGRSFAQAAAEFRGDAGAKQAATQAATPGPQRRFLDALFAADLWKLTREHLELVFVSLAAAIAAGVPLGVLAARWPRWAQPVFALVGVVQTIP